MEYPYKEVHFHDYCVKCKYYDRKEEEDPCFDCLEEPVNLYSHKPLKFEELVNLYSHKPLKFEEAEKHASHK